MQQLSGLDAAFLELDTGFTRAHVGCLCVFAGRVTVADLRAVVASRMDRLPVFGRRLRMVPGGLDHPWWLPVGDLDLADHVQEVALPPGDERRRLADLVARLHAEPLDRARPLWRMRLVTGLSGGRCALYVQVHHAALDGVAVGDVVTVLLDDAPVPWVRSPVPDAAPAARALPYVPAERPPGSWRLLLRAAVTGARTPARVARLGVGLAAAAPGVVRTLRPLVAGRTVGDVLRRLRGPGPWAPPTPFNRPISAARACAFASLPLADFSTLRRGTDLTVNDVLMGLVAGALRRWLERRDALPATRLVAAVPVALPGAAGSEDGPAVVGQGGNHVSFLLAALATSEPDALARLVAAHEALQRAKAGHAAIPAGLLADLTQLTPPWLGRAGWAVLRRLRVLQRGFNLVVSNVPGPRAALYLAGAEMVEWFPLSAVADGQGLNITVLSYAGVLHAGLVAAPELVPDLDVLAGYLSDELAVSLRRRAGQGSPGA